MCYNVYRGDDMYILAQGGRGIVSDFKSMWIETGRINEIVVYDDYEELNPIVLGDYSTPERCEEIIDSIFRALKRNDYIYRMPEK